MFSARRSVYIKLSLDAIAEGKRFGAVQVDPELDTEFVEFDS